MLERFAEIARLIARYSQRALMLGHRKKTQRYHLYNVPVLLQLSGEERKSATADPLFGFRSTQSIVVSLKNTLLAKTQQGPCNLSGVVAQSEKRLQAKLRVRLVDKREASSIGFLHEKNFPFDQKKERSAGKNLYS